MSLNQCPSPSIQPCIGKDPKEDPCPFLKLGASGATILPSHYGFPAFFVRLAKHLLVIKGFVIWKELTITSNYSN